MLIVKLKKGENINRALKQFKQKVRNTKLIRTIRENQYFEKPSAKRKRKKAEGIKRYQRALKKKQERLGY